MLLDIAFYQAVPELPPGCRLLNQLRVERGGKVLAHRRRHVNVNLARQPWPATSAAQLPPQLVELRA